VASPFWVMTNLRLAQSTVDEICLRCRCGLALERRVESITGKVLQDPTGRKGDAYKNIKAELRSLDGMPKMNHVNFNEELLDLCKSELSEHDKLEVAKLIRESWRKSVRRREHCQRLTKEEELAKLLDSHISGIERRGVKSTTKRVSNFPMIVAADRPWDERRVMPALGASKTVPESYMKLWNSATESLAWMDEKNYIQNRIMSKEESMDPSRATLKHDMRKRSTISPDLNKSDMDFIALSGPGAKMRAELEEIKKKESESKLSFSPRSNTDDIHKFITDDTLTWQEREPDIDDCIMETLLKTKNDFHNSAESINVFKWLRHRSISQHASLITDICTELSYEYKIPHRGNQWGVKLLRNQEAILLYRSTSTHTFFSVAVAKAHAYNFDTGRLGPEVYETDNYFISDFSSISEDGLDHFVKALPYVMSLQALMYQVFSLPLPQKNIILPQSYWETLKTVYLLYLNNKLDAEEIVTSLRYLYMNILQESFSDVTLFVDRLPELLRSRLSAYLLQKTCSLMRFYCNRSVRRIRLRDQAGRSRYKLFSVKNVFTRMDMNMSQLINSFYFGYVVSKSRGKVGDRNIKVLSKVISEEFWFLDNIRSKNICIWNPTEEPKKHHWSPALMKYMIDHHISQMNKVYGNTFAEILEQDLLDTISKCTFTEIATLKASAREEEFNFFVPDPKEFDSYRELKAELLEKNPTQQGRRPRVIVKLFQAVAEYMIETGNPDPRVYEVCVWALKKVNKMGYILCDMFPKDQHGGDREIHVLHIYSRLSQFLIEKMSRVICTYYPSDSIVNPKYKDSYYYDHQKRAQIQLGDHYTVCKSADATKWCQRHHSSKFFLLIARYCPDYFLSYVYLIMYFWTRKRLVVPVDISANFEKNKSTPSSSAFYKEFRKRYYSGQAPFVSMRQRNEVENEAGMWQGILHITSTLLHTNMQNFWASYASSYLQKQNINAVVDVIQGSDDSAALISTNDTRQSVCILLELLLDMKEELAAWISIFKSEAKSSIGTINLIEYNSEWVMDNNILKPTTRWALACMETTLVERFVTRLETYYSVLTQTLESGGTTFLCSIIQMCQGYMHYMLLGFRNHILRDELCELCYNSKLVPLGFFPLDSDLNAGVTGFDFLMYRTSELFEVPTHAYDVEELGPSALLEYEGKVDKTLRRDINSTKVAFGNYYIWNKLIEDADIEKLEDLLLEAEKNPRLLYMPDKGWQSNKVTCSLKFYQPGVKSSLSIHQPNIRMMSASSYIASRACMSLPMFEDKEKFSLYHLLRLGTRWFSDKRQSLLNRVDFPHQSEYAEFNKYLEEALSTYFFQPVEMKRSDKSTVLVWGSELTSEIPLMDICIRAWWGVKTVKVSSTMFQSIWKQTKARYPFLMDSSEETCDKCGMNQIELYHFLQSVAKRVRKLKLQDTPSKDSSKEAALTRVYWPDLKVRSDAMRDLGDIHTLRHHVFCVLTFPFTVSFKATKVRDLLLKNPTLSRRFEDVPRLAKRLKIMRDFLKEGDLMKLVLQIETLKKGCIGFFSVVQEPKQKGKKHEYSGPGEWLGRVCGIPCKIEMRNKKVTNITLQRLSDLLELSTSLRSLILEFKLDMPEMPEHSGSNLYLTEMGYFESDRRVLPNSCRISIDSSFQMSVFDEMDNYNWSLKTINNQLKLVCKRKMKYGESPEFTILSDTFVNRDWDPTEDLLEGMPKMFSHWQDGSPAPLSGIIDLYQSGVESKDILSLLGNLEGSSSWTQGIMDLRRFSEFLAYNVKNNYTNKMDQLVHEQIEIEKARNEHTVFSEAMIESLLKFESPLDSVLEDISEQVEQEIQGSEDISEEDSQILDETVLSRLNEIFFSVDWTFEEEEIRRKLFRTDMPASNSFFSNLYNTIEFEGIREEIVTYLSYPNEDNFRRIRAPSELRLLLSVAWKRLLAPRHSTVAAHTIEAMSHSEASISSFTEDFLITKDVKELEDSLRQLKEILPGTSGQLRRKFENMIKKYEIELSAVNSSMEHLSLAYLNYWQFFETLISKIRQKQIWVKDLPEADLLSLRTILIGDCMDVCMSKFRMGTLPKTERDEFGATAWAETVSSGLVKMLCHGLRASISIDINGENVFEYSVRMATNDIDLSFIVQELENTPTQEFARSGF